MTTETTTRTGAQLRRDGLHGDDGAYVGTGVRWAHTGWSECRGRVEMHGYWTGDDPEDTRRAVVIYDTPGACDACREAGSEADCSMAAG